MKIQLQSIQKWSENKGPPQKKWPRVHREDKGTTELQRRRSDTVVGGDANPRRPFNLVSRLQRVKPFLNYVAGIYSLVAFLQQSVKR